MGIALNVSSLFSFEYNFILKNIPIQPTQTQACIELGRNNLIKLAIES